MVENGSNWAGHYLVSESHVFSGLPNIVAMLENVTQSTGNGNVMPTTPTLPYKQQRGLAGSTN